MKELVIRSAVQASTPHGRRSGATPKHRFEEKAPVAAGSLAAELVRLILARLYGRTHAIHPARGISSRPVCEYSLMRPLKRGEG